MNTFFKIIVLLVIGSVLQVQPCLAQKNKKNKDQDPISKEQRESHDRIFFEANKYKFLNEIEKSIELYKQCIAIDDKNDAAFYEIGNYYLAQNKIDDALSNYQKAADIKPGNIWYQKAIAETDMQKGDYKNALKVYDGLLKNKPDDIDLLYEKSLLQRDAKDLEGAVKTLNLVEKQIGISPELISDKQDLYMRMGKIDKAAEEVEKLIAEYPQELNYVGLLAALYDANGMTDKAIANYNKILTIDPQNGRANYGLAMIEKERKNMTAYSELIRKAFRSKDLDIDTKVKYVMPMFTDIIAKNQAATQEAAELSKIIVEAHPTQSKSNALYADILYQQDKNLEALEYYKKAISYDNTVQQVWIQVLTIEAEQRLTQDLYKHSMEAIELFPNSPIVNFFAGISALDRKEYKKAETALENVLMMSAGNKALQAEAHTRLGELYNITKEYKKSDSNFDEALSLSPDMLYTKNNYAYYLSVRGEQLEKAEKLSKETITAEPTNSTYLDTYGWILYQQKKYNDAQLYIEKAIQNGADKNGEVLEHAGDVAYQLGNTDKAVQYWIEAKKQGGTTENIQLKIDQKKIVDK